VLLPDQGSQLERLVCMVGAFPPPVHGMAAVNFAMRGLLEAYGSSPVVFDVSSRSLGRSPGIRLARMWRVARVFVTYCCSIIRASSPVSVYLSVSGGFGQFYDALFIGFARMCGASTFLHHHNFGYLVKPVLRTRLLMAIAGPDALHIVLCNAMRTQLASCYPSVRRVLTMSNTALVDHSPVRTRRRSGLRIIGYLGNIERQKGIFDFLDVVRGLKSAGRSIGGLIAGPFQDPVTQHEVVTQINGIADIRYLGATYGDAKRQFYESIDVLVYPTYDDAEPLTLLEAMSYGVPVIARSRGCIGEMIAGAGGLVIGNGEDFPKAAIGQLSKWMDQPDFPGQHSSAAIQRVAAMTLHNKVELAKLYAEMTGRALQIPEHPLPQVGMIRTPPGAPVDRNS
jgi:glycosyltransferase involved in cell wall biosynthesis